MHFWGGQQNILRVILRPLQECFTQLCIIFAFDATSVLKKSAVPIINALLSSPLQLRAQSSSPFRFERMEMAFLFLCPSSGRPARECVSRLHFRPIVPPASSGREKVIS